MRWGKRCLGSACLLPALMGGKWEWNGGIGVGGVWLGIGTPIVLGTFLLLRDIPEEGKMASLFRLVFFPPSMAGGMVGNRPDSFPRLSLYIDMIKHNEDISPIIWRVPLCV